MTVKDKLLRYIKGRQTPVTSFQIAERFACHLDTARQAMRQLIKDGLAEPQFVLRTNKFVIAIKRSEK